MTAETAWHAMEAWLVLEVWRVALVVARVLPVLVLLPPPLSRALPAVVRLPLLVFLVAGAFPEGYRLPDGEGPLWGAVAVEAFRGLVVALVVWCAVEVLRVAGAVIDVVSGRGSFGAGDAGGGSHGFAVLGGLAAAALFLAGGGPFLLLDGFALSFALTPPGSPVADVAGVGEEMTRVVLGLVVAGVSLVVPLWTAVLVMEVSMGWMQRVMPSLPTHLVVMPLRAGICWLCLAMALQVLLPAVTQWIQEALIHFPGVLQ